MRYRERGNRCEGVYEQPYSGPVYEDSDLTVVALYSVFEYENTDTTSLHVTWPDIANGRPVVLRARSKRRGLWYRMDAEMLSERAFTWPTDVLSRVDLTHDEVAIRGWFEAKIGHGTHRVFLPLRIAQSPVAPTEPAGGHVMVQIVPQGQIVSANTTQARIRSGQPPDYYRREEPLAPAGISGGAVTVFELRLEPPGGIHRIQLAVELLGGGSADVTFYCAPGGPEGH
ncbi:hypothetical protein K8I85_05325 [bacterium]|nr:hypothetical protein [bacterium]